MKLTVLSDNYAPPSIGLKGEHGFSVLLERDKETILFDVGQHGLCVDNANILGIDLKKINKLVLSHGHYDHAGGLEKVLRAIGHPVEIIAHSSIFEKKYAKRPQFSKNIYIGIPWTQEYLGDTLGAVFNFQDGFYELEKGVWTTGEVPFTNDFEKTDHTLKVEKEGSMVDDTFPDDNSIILDLGNKGIFLLLGCAHRGMVNIASYAKEKFGKPLYGIMGGTHLYEADGTHIARIRHYLKEEGVKLFAPSHCTGIQHILYFASSMPDITKPAFSGTSFEI